MAWSASRQIACWAACVNADTHSASVRVRQVPMATPRSRTQRTERNARVPVPDGIGSHLVVVYMIASGLSIGGIWRGDIGGGEEAKRKWPCSCVPAFNVGSYCRQADRTFRARFISCQSGRAERRSYRFLNHLTYLQITDTGRIYLPT
ncbi:hypothetical protein LZ31DRAFT_573873 [Colletotrichum somersetense]|nr:hypothetical protein LZ31DRAFT_573873 [Colletotrichum somersetense]